MKIICAECKRQIGEIASTCHPDAVSHGLCKPCARKVLRDAGLAIPASLQDTPEDVEREKKAAYRALVGMVLDGTAVLLTRGTEAK